MKLVNFKADEADYVKWKAWAKEESLTFGEWARRRLNHAPVIAPAIATLAATKVSSTRSAPGCEHRLPRGSWCKSCRTIKK